MKTEVFATFGPACKDKEILEKMIQAGMTGMRLNLSHGTLLESRAYIEAYDAAAQNAGVERKVLIDMQGPELRLGKLEAPLLLNEGERFVPPIPQPVVQTLEVGDEVLFDDGKILAQVCKVNEQSLQVEMHVLRGGTLLGGKSVKIVGKDVKMPPLTEHDVENIKHAKEYGITGLMQPFVLSGDDLKYVRNVLNKYGLEEVLIFAKIENRLGVENLDSILEEADVIVIARGDLGNDMPLWELPRVQKQIEEACHKAKKPYVVVTQMLASMEQNPVPTRAEVSDIFHAVFCGAYGIMITGETAVGKYPVESVRYLTNTALQAEVFKEEKQCHL